MTVVVCTAESPEQLAAASAVRFEVFVREQRVPAELEADGLDGASSHFLATLDGKPVAAARARRTPGGYKLERVAVLGPERGRAVGTSLVAHILKGAPAGQRVYVHAQVSALGFWRRAGFVTEGPPFDEAGIAHHTMFLSAGASPAGSLVAGSPTAGKGDVE